MYEKYLKIYFTNEEFDKVVEYGIHKLEYEYHNNILEHINKKETRYNGRKQY